MYTHLHIYTYTHNILTLSTHIYVFTFVFEKSNKICLCFIGTPLIYLYSVLYIVSVFGNVKRMIEWEEWE